MDLKYLTIKGASAGPDGQIKVVFSDFDQIDDDGDIVMASAVTPGQEAPMVWAHNWDMPIGKGVVSVSGNKAVFDGQLNLNTTWGKDAYEAIKFAGGLQEYSWGFRPTDVAYEERDGRPVRLIKGATLYEVSPVLVGANRNTYTMAIKAAEGPQSVAEFATLVKQHGYDLAQRTRDLSERRTAEGRPLSDANRAALSEALKGLRDSADAIDILITLDKAHPAEAGVGMRLYLQWQQTEARLAGVA